jgi:DNA mismatch repair protein MutS2
MIYPHNFEQKVGFDQVREMIRAICVSPMGEEFVDKIRFSANRDLIRKRLNQVAEFKDILTRNVAFPGKDYFDLREELSRLATPGSYIEQQALFDLKTSLTTIRDIISFFEKADSEDYRELKLLVTDLYLPEEIIPNAARIIDDKGEVNDTASEKLADIRKQLKAKTKQVLSATRKAFEQAKKSGWVIDNAEVTIRNGRAVIPVHAADKRALGGIIHDESASGQTVFVEPSRSFEINNQIRELENDERREIINILTLFTDTIRPWLDSLKALYRFLGLIDFIRAKAGFALKLKGENPKISADSTLILEEAIHPLLYLTHQAAGKTVVPLDLELNKEERILIISGPNAGGKSVCLKTVGILQYMFQCGLQPACSPDSSLPVFDRLFIDIGDEQSLENDLSTYSSHLLNMKYFLQKSNSKTMFLIDEFGTGTEPQLGGAIAEAVLEQLNQKKAFGVVTTHYSNLKTAAQKTKGLINGAMLFDSGEMRPLYKLQTGNPGSSFAFEIARNIGFPDNVLNRAKKKSGGKHVSFDQQLQQLETDKLEIQKKEESLKVKDRQLTALVDKYTNLLDDIKRNKKHLIDKARQEAYEIVASSNKAVEKTIREIKEVKADSSRTRGIRKKLEYKKEEIRTRVEEGKKAEVPKVTEGKKRKPKKEGLKAGDYVQVKDTDIVGVLVSIEGADAYVDVNDVKLKTSANKLIIAEKVPSKMAGKRTGISFTEDISQKAANFNLSIDLRGKRADEALSLLGKYIDDATMLSIREVNILHGKGDGILRPIIREYLQTVREIEKFQDAPLEMGGAGITRVFFR